MMMFLAVVSSFKRIRSSQIKRILTNVELKEPFFCKPLVYQKVQFRANSDKKSIVSHHEGSQVSTNVREVVKETTKTVSYSAVILVGVGITAVLFYAIFRELFSSKSPNNIYSKALERCLKEEKVVDALGEPIKGFGEETRRGRRRFVSHIMYEVQGVPHMRMRFYLKGSRKSATANLEVKENEAGDFVYRYLFVQLDDYPNRVIVIEDNRQDLSKTLLDVPETIL